MKQIDCPLEGVIIIAPTVHADNRGYFYEAYQQRRYSELDLPAFVQDNTSRSNQHVIRGMHYQSPSAQGKLVGVTHGEVLDVIVDLRKHSPTFKQYFMIKLNDENHLQMYVPPGFAHGFCVLSKFADFYYKCTDFYAPQNEHGIIWNDPELNIPWPTQNPIISNKDLALPTLAEIPDAHFFA